MVFPKDWQLADAKNKLSEVVRRALAEGPQRITRRDEAVIVLSQKDFDALTGKQPTLGAFLMEPGPDFDGVDLKRDPSIGREVNL